MKRLPVSNKPLLFDGNGIESGAPESGEDRQNHNLKNLANTYLLSPGLACPETPKKQKGRPKSLPGSFDIPVVKEALRSLMKEDLNAKNYFAGYKLPYGRSLPLKHQLKYVRQSEWLNVARQILMRKDYFKSHFKMGMIAFWNILAEVYLQDSVKHDLPSSVRRLQDKYKAYEEGGYGALVELYRFNNENARHTSERTERLILSLYCQPHLPDKKGLIDEFNQFLSGRKIIADVQTNEPFDPKDFLADIQCQRLSPQVIRHYLGLPKNKVFISQYRGHRAEPDEHKRPLSLKGSVSYAFSRLSVSYETFSCSGGGLTHISKIFVIADEESGAIVGASSGNESDSFLIRQCLRDMMRMVAIQKWAIPLVIEVELSSKTEGRNRKNDIDFFTEAHIIPYARFYPAASDGQSKTERFITRFKCAAREFFQNRLNRSNDKFQDHLKACLKDSMSGYNNTLHTDQAKYTGMTRSMVLAKTQNPNGVLYENKITAPYIGHYSPVIIDNGKVSIGNIHFKVADDLLHDSHLDAYYIPGLSRNGDTLYLYLNGVFICESTPEMENVPI